jgi:hypothetical protein
VTAERQREPWWLVALALVGFLVVFALVALVYLSELAPAVPALRAWLRAFLFG